MKKKDLAEQWRRTGLVSDREVLQAFEAVDREKFILKDFLDESYGDYPLPIGYDQTISQPSTIIIMLQALELKKKDIVLEIGAGSGYNAALISRICSKVYSIEIIKDLAVFASENLARAGIKNVEVLHADGSLGYEKAAPYDRIIVTAACPAIPPPLLQQLEVEGIIVAPVGDVLGQKMIKGVKTREGMNYSSLGDFQFVPLAGQYGR
ncbi:MAG: protein-L-isoaspartate(D-aspartate) O-methyltransferase [Candidatus Woesearchaeota archaeon]